VRIATTERYTDREGQKKEDTQWHDVVIWGKTAESIHEYLVKGKQIYVEGRLQTRKWTDKEGKDRYNTEVRADRVVLLGGGGGGEGRPRPSRDRYAAAEGVEAAPDMAAVDAPNDDDIPF
jgi:single-strand DNA-binding protein